MYTYFERRIRGWEGNMGGSGSGESSGGGTSGGDFSVGAQVDCGNLVFECSIASPVAPVETSLTVGDVCDVALWSDPTRIVVLTRPGRELLGAIIDHWQELVACIGRGVAFEAEILQVASYVRVEVRPVP